MNKFIKNFEMELNTLQPVPPPISNMVIGGSCALVLHGLNIGREPEDLDIVLFMPSEEQKLFVRKYFKPCMTYGKAENIFEAVRVFELVKNGMKMNVMLAYDEPTPFYLLSYFTFNMEFKINSIKNIIDAKLSYSQGKDKAYLRAKDMKHLMDFKNLNFNV